MRWYKIRAILSRDILTFVKTKERLVEVLFYPITTTLIWGMFANYFSDISLETSMMLLATNVFWTFSYLSQSAANLQINVDVWSRSLNQLLVSGINEVEYIIARLIFSAAASTVILGLMMFIVSFFGFRFPALGPFVLLVLVTLLASMALSVLIFALFIMLGKEYAFLSWTFLQLIILLSAPFFPIEIYPVPIQYISKILPHTYVFNAVKTMAQTGRVPLNQVYLGLGISVAFLIVVFPFYLWVFKRARKKGQLVRLGF